MDILSRKSIDNFRGKVVRKDLTSLMKRGVNVPTYVLEYLLGMYCATDDEAAIATGVQKITKILTENYVRPDEQQRIKYLIRENGEYTVIDKISAELDEKYDCYSATLANLGLNSFVLPEEYVRNYTKVLSGGVWCMLKIAYQRLEGEEETSAVATKGKRSKKNPFESPFKVVSMKPIQMANLNVDEFIGKRKNFTTEEWILLLLRSAGIEGARLNLKERFHYLERMVPLVERNYNLCELGPRGTGKSHLYKEISPYAILMSGGQTTTSNLFYNMNSHRIGLVGNWDCVAFDEVAGMRFRDRDAIQIMKDYMASGSFARGREQISADSSMVFVGNINDTVENLLKVTHLFEPFPPEYNQDSAFFDRIHYYLPGWEIPKMKSDLLTEEYGLITDCLAEFTREMRKHDFSHVLDKWYKLNNCVTTRDEIAVRKTVSGLLKLVFPDHSYTKEDVALCLAYALEGRRRVKEQLRKIAGVEFADVDLGYISDDGKSVIVYVPEQTDDALIPDETLLPGHVFAIGTSLEDGIPAVYKLENKTIRGSGKLEIQGIKGYGAGAKLVKESINAAWMFYLDNGNKVSRVERMLEKDYLFYYADPQNKYMSAEVSVAEFIGLCSAATGKAVLPGYAVVGELTLSGTVNVVKRLEDHVRVAYNAGATHLLLPEACRSQYEEISDPTLRIVIPVYYDTPVEAAKVALGIW